MKRCWIFILLIPSIAHAGWYGAWTYRKAISAPKNRVLDGTPFYVDLSSDTDIHAHAQSNCNDVLFTASDGTTKLAHRWKGTCGGVFIGTVLSSSTENTFYVYFGSTTASDQSNAAGVWDNKYTNVYEFYNGALTDDVGGNTCVLMQGTTKVEPSEMFNGSSLYFDGKTYLRCPATLGSHYTVEAWFRGGAIVAENRTGTVFTVGSSGSIWGTAFSWDDGPSGRGWMFGSNNNPTPIAPAFLRRTTDYLKADRYQHIMSSDDGSILTATWNGVAASTMTSGSLISNGFIYIGSNYYFNTPPDCSTGSCFQGWIDEIRISSANRKSSWAGTEYENVRYPGLFYGIGALEQNTSALPVINSFTAETNILSGESAKLKWFVSGATSISIDHSVGSQSDLVYGSVSVTPGSTTTYTLTATNGAGVTTSTWTVNVLASGLYLRSGPPADVGFCGYTLSPFKLYVCAGQEAGFQVGDRISVWGLCADDVTHYYFPNFGWRIKISSMTDAGTITGITNLDGSSITPNAAWKNCISPNASQVAYGGAVTLYPTPPSYAAGGFDGPTGKIMRQIGISTDNGLTSLVVSGGVATVTTSFTHDVQVGDKVTVWGTTAASGDLNSSLGALNGVTWIFNDHIVTAATSNTYQFTTTSPDGTYTTNNSCSPYANCVVVSQRAISTNVAIPDLMKYVDGYGNSPPVYKCSFDGGPQSCEEGMWINNGRGVAILNYIDRGNAPVHDGLVYILTHIERINGNAWTMPESPLVSYEAGNRVVSYPEAIFYVPGTFTLSLAKILLTSGEQTTLRDKIFGDIWYANTSTPCNKTRSLLHPQPSEDIANGTAQGGTLTSVILASTDSASNGFYVNYAVLLVDYDSSQNYYGYQRLGLISAYDSTTKTATITTPGYPYTVWTSSPIVPSASPTTTLYRILPTAKALTWSNGGVVSGDHNYGGVTGTIVGTGTHFLSFSTGTVSPFLAADTIYTGPDGDTIPVFMEAGGQAQFTAIADDTHATVMLNNFTRLTTSYWVPTFWSYGWRSGDCGVRWAMEHQGWDTQELQHKDSFLSSFGSARFPEVTRLNNNSPIGQVNEMAMDLGFAADDVRAEHDAEGTQSISHGWWMMADMAAQGGLLPDGFGYNLQDLRNASDYTLAIAKSVPSFPSMDLSGAWLRNQVYWKMYSMRPDNPGDGTVKYGYILGAGSNNGDPLNNQSPSWDYNYDNFSAFNPTDLLAQRYKSFNTAWVPPGAGGNDARIFAGIDPRITTSDYKNMTLQRALLGDSKATCRALTGWDCWPNYQGGAAFSFGSTQTVTANRWTDRTATLLAVASSGGQTSTYQAASGAALGIFHVGGFIGCDGGLSTQGPTSGVNLFELGYAVDGDVTKLCDSLDFGGANYNFTGTFLSGDYSWPIMDRWASVGNADANAGDPNSNYMYLRIDERGSYGSRPNRAFREVIHMKKPGTEEIIIDRRDVDITNASSQTITEHIHYQQNGEAVNNDYYSFYQEGSPPSCPSSNAQCVSSLDSTRVIVSSEDNAPADSVGPARNATLITKFIVPSDIPIQLRYDGHAFPGSHGHTERVSICAGTCGSSTTLTMDYIKVHKIATIPDVSLTTTTLKDDGQWIIGQTTDKVFAFSRGGVLRSSASFTSTHSGTAQYLLTGISSGTYNVTVGGVAVLTSSPVYANDNSLYFESTAGLVQLSTGIPPCAISPPTLPNGTQNISYSQNLSSANCNSSSWTISSGSLCSGLSLGSTTGIISGTPTTAQTCSFTAAYDTATDPLSITINSNGSISPTSILRGTIKITGGVSVK